MHLVRSTVPVGGCRSVRSFAECMNHILDEVALMGPLESSARAIIDFVTVRSSKSKFDLTSSGEWALYPDNWIALKFTHIRKYAIHISLGVFPTTIEDEGRRLGIEIKNGRYPNWSKISIYRDSELSHALEILEVAYQNSDNKHRHWYGKPKKGADLSRIQHGGT
jgi:hypothetical protein